MSVICSKCGCADVLCEAMINPNTKVFENYTGESFLYGWCNVCQTGRTLTELKSLCDCGGEDFIIIGFIGFEKV